MKLSLICLLIITAALMLPGCNGGEITVDTEFEEILSNVPYQVAVNYDIFYGDPRQAKELNGLEELDTFQEAEEIIRELPGEQGMQFVQDWGTAACFASEWTQPDFTSLTGFDLMEIDFVICGNVIPPNGFFILKGDFNEALIGQKLTEQGYAKMEYGQHSYYSIRDDYEIDIRDPLGQIVFAGMNRVAVIDGLIITSPVTADVTGIFDTMDGNSPSVLDNEMCQALADSLGDPIVASMTTPERLILNRQHIDDPGVFYFTIPADWGTLQGYEMAALGYRAEGDACYFDIALYYTDKQAAEADGEEIVKRMQSYQISTWISGWDTPRFFTDWWQLEEPVVTERAGGAILKISCRALSDIPDVIHKEPYWASEFLGGQSPPYRDLLFLAIEPAQYIAQND